MAEALRTNTLTGDLPCGSAVPSDEPRVNGQGLLPELPQTTAVSAPARSSNPSLNRSAEAVGRGMGTAVAGVRRLPQQFDRLRSKIHLVKRDEIAAALQDSAAEVVGDWRDAAEGSVAEIAETARKYRYAIADRTNRRLEEFRQIGRRKLYVLRIRTRLRLAEVRHWESERPLQVITVCAGIAFGAGVALRVWRSNSD